MEVFWLQALFPPDCLNLSFKSDIDWLALGHIQDYPGIIPAEKFFHKPVLPFATFYCPADNIGRTGHSDKFGNRPKKSLN
jgi:hypothetical protein